MCAGPQQLSATARAGTWHESTGEHSPTAREREQRWHKDCAMWLPQPHYEPRRRWSLERDLESWTDSSAVGLWLSGFFRNSSFKL